MILWLRNNFIFAAVAVALTACGGGNELSYDTAVEVDISGLAVDAQIAAQLNNDEVAVFTGPGKYTFTRRIPVGDNYSVSLTEMPNNDQVCSLSEGEGKITDQTATVIVDCVTPINVKVEGLDPSGSISFRLNDDVELAVTGSGQFLFDKKLPAGSTYSVKIINQPANHQKCSIQENTGTVTGNTANIDVTCDTSVEVNVEGLAGGQFDLQINQDETLTAVENGKKTFLKRLAVGEAYQVEVLAQPGGFQWCTATGATGTATSGTNTVNVRCSTSSAITSTLAGTGTASLTNGPASTATFNKPNGLAYDKDGNLYIADDGNKVIRKMDVNGNVSTFAGTAGVSGFADGPVGVGSFGAFGASGLAFDRHGNLYVTDSGSHTIRKVSPSGNITTVAGMKGVSGYADGPASSAKLNNPNGLAFDSSGNLFFVDTGNALIRKLDTNGVVSTVTGVVNVRGANDGPKGTATLGVAFSLVIDKNDILYFSDRYAGVRMADKDGYVKTITTGDSYRNIDALALDPWGNFYVGGTGYQSGIKKTKNGDTGTLLTGYWYTGYVDGKGRVARFNGMANIIFDSSGNLIVADRENNAVRKVTQAAP